MRPIAISLSPNTDRSDVILSLKALFIFWNYKTGGLVRNLEAWFRQFFSVSHAVSFASGRAALYTVLKALGVGKGDEVILQSFTCVAVPNAIIATGAIPVYADIDDSLNISIEYLKNSISKKTKAIIVQHTFGIPCDMKEIIKIAKEKNIYVVEDCAHTIGGEFQGKKLGTFGISSIFSFGRDKAFSSVSGGMAVTNDKNLGKRIREESRKFSYPKASWIFAQLFHPVAFSIILPLYDFLFIGKILLILFQKLRLLTFPVLEKEKEGRMSDEFVKKMPNVLAGLILHQLKRLNTFNRTRSFFVDYYVSELSNHNVFTIPCVKTEPLLRFPVLIKNRDEVLDFLKKRNIYLGKWYSEIIDPKGVDYKKIYYQIGSCPKAEYTASRIINLPTYPYLKKSQAEKIAAILSCHPAVWRDPTRVSQLVRHTSEVSRSDSSDGGGITTEFTSEESRSLPRHHPRWTGAKLVTMSATTVFTKVNSMITIKEITEKQVWEKFIESFPQDFPPFFQTWNWGETQKKRSARVIRLGLFDNNVLVGISSVIAVMAKRGKYLHLRHGPLLINFEKYFDHFIDYIKKLGKEKGASFIRISPYIAAEKQTYDFFRKRGFRDSPIHKMDGEVCLVIDTTKSEEILLKEMRKSHRYLIRKAQTANIKIIKSTDLKDIAIFLELYKDLSKRKHFVPHPGIAEEFEIFSKDNQAVLFLAEYDKKIISGALIIFLSKMAIYHHAVTLDTYRNIPSMYLLQWEVIKEVKTRKIPFYNLWGVTADGDSKRHPWQGLSFFKKGFGGEMKEFVHAQDLPLNFLYWKTYLIDCLTRLTKGY